MNDTIKTLKQSFIKELSKIMVWFEMKPSLFEVQGHIRKVTLNMIIITWITSLHVLTLYLSMQNES